MKAPFLAATLNVAARRSGLPQSCFFGKFGHLAIDTTQFLCYNCNVNVHGKDREDSLFLSQLQVRREA